MMPKKVSVIAGLALSAALWCVGPTFAQYREYYFHGKVIDTDKKPLDGVEIKLRDVATSRGYGVKTNKNGEFKFAGLPHGIYKVTFEKEGFAVKEDEWRFAEPQESIRKVEIPDVILVSQTLVERAEQLKAMEAEIKAAADKIRARDFEGAVGQLNEYLAKHPDDSNAL
ncbi:MAG: carboxypeptidase regulatory-like domain-containing protein, partial [Candidatus Aminicenantes bacterium]|nr:carboxypeptidase regulatory-like domain-containing protein [Candidatus Aminicenantes bacterium]